jgi:hypothetical protein
MRRTLVAAGAALCLALAAPALAPAASPPSSWDNLVKVDSRKLNAVYLLPGADFRQYNKVMLDPTEVAFQRNWMRDFNSSTRGLSRRITDRDAQRILDQVRDGFQSVFTRAFTDAGITVVTEPGPDVLRLRSAVINLRVNAPDIPSAGRSRTYAPEAGQATMVLEARDSETGAILGRAVDGRVAGDMGGFVRGSIRNSVTNRADFERLFRDWARASVNGFNTLRSGGK